jgi:hypothetical protein
MDLGQTRRPVNDMRTAERESVVQHVESNAGLRSQIRQLPLPSFPAQNTLSRSLEMAPGSIVVDNGSNHNFSQSWADPSSSRDGDRFSVPERSYQNFINPSSVSSQQYGGAFARSSTGVHHEQERPQVQYLQEHK